MKQNVVSLWNKVGYRQDFIRFFQVFDKMGLDPIVLFRFNPYEVYFLCFKLHQNILVPLTVIIDETNIAFINGKRHIR